MRILHTVEFYEPSKGGAQEVIRQISERLVKRGHEVTVATTHLPQRSDRVINGVKIEEFRISGNAVKGISGETERYQQYIVNADFDVMMNYAAEIWTTDLVFPVLDSVRMKTCVMPLGYSKLWHPRYRKYFRTIPGYLDKYDVIAYTSPNYKDKLFGDKAGLGYKSVIIPNGASLEEFSAEPLGFRERYGITTPLMFLCVSNHYVPKGHLAVIREFRKAATDDCTLVIIGERPSARPWKSCAWFCERHASKDARIRSISGVPREWVVSAYQEADMFLFASWYECAPLVMYESFASHTPFVTTDVGNVKDHREQITLLNASRDMAAVIRAFLRDPEPFKKNARNAHRLFLEHHTWEKLVDRFEELYTDLHNGTLPASRRQTPAGV